LGGHKKKKSGTNDLAEKKILVRKTDEKAKAQLLAQSVE
jgi:hypothetical protein